MCRRWERGSSGCVWIAEQAASLQVLCGGIRNPKGTRGQKSRGERRGKIAQKFWEFHGNLKRRYALVGLRRLPFDGATSAADGTADADSRQRESAWVAGLPEVDGGLDERDGSGGRKCKQGQGIAHGRERDSENLECSATHTKTGVSLVDQVRRRRQEHADEELHRAGVRQQSRRDRPDRGGASQARPVVSRDVALTDEESQDLVTGPATGNGAEAWRKFVKRGDPVVAGRNRALPEAIITPQVKIQRAQVRVTKDEKGEQLELTGIVKMTAFESMLPYEMETILC